MDCELSIFDYLCGAFCDRKVRDVDGSVAQLDRATAF